MVILIECLWEYLPLFIFLQWLLSNYLYFYLSSSIGMNYIVLFHVLLYFVHLGIRCVSMDKQLIVHL